MTRIATVLGFAIVIAMAGPAVAAGPRGKVTPNKRLTNGETVTASGKGFAPEELVYVVQCNGSVKSSGESACNLDNYNTTTTTAKGVVPPTKLTVQTGVIGNGSCGTSKTDKDCYIAISNESLTDYAFVKIMFAVK